MSNYFNHDFIDELTEAKEKMKGCYWKMFGIGVLFILIMLVSCVTLVGPFIIFGPMYLGFHRAILQLARTKKVKFSTLFSGFKDFGVAFRVGWLFGIRIFLWSLLLIVPGIIAAIRYSMTFFILADNPNITAREAISKSKKMIKGRKREFVKNWGLYFGLAYLVNIFSNRFYMFGIQEGLNGMVAVASMLSVVASVWSIFVAPFWILMLPEKFYKDNFSEEVASNTEKSSENIIKEKKPRKPLSAKAKKKIIAIVAGSVCGVLAVGGIFFIVKQIQESSFFMKKNPGKNYSISRTEVTQKLYESVIGKNPSYFYRDNMVKIPGRNFLMLKTEVTQELYGVVMGENPSYFFKKNNPVENVSWYDALYFCNKLSEELGCMPVYAVNGDTDVAKWNYIPHEGKILEGIISQLPSADGFRLPTVKEWQVAAKGGSTYIYSGSNVLDEVCWYSENSEKSSHPVAQKKANGYGLYDMSGNVWEWCWDSDNFSHHYRCGGSWNRNANFTKVSIHYALSAPSRNQFTGFRIVCSAK